MTHNSVHGTDMSDDNRIVRVADVDCGEANALQTLAAKLGQGPFALIILLIAPSADFEIAR